VDADGGRQDGDVAGERLEHGEAEALGVGGHEHGVRGVDPEGDLVGRRGAEGRQARVARDLAGAVGALDRAGRVGREEQQRLARVEAEALARLGARDRAEAMGIDAARQDGRGRRVRELLREALGRGRHEVEARERGERDAPCARVAQVGAVEGDRALGAAHGEGRPGGEAVVRVDDVEALAPRAAGGEGGQRARAWGRLVELDLEALDPAQRVDLVADEDPAPGVLRVGPHVGDDERAHLRRRGYADS
jgi:hypothetical protein